MNQRRTEGPDPSASGGNFDPDPGVDQGDPLLAQQVPAQRVFTEPPAAADPPPPPDITLHRYADSERNYLATTVCKLTGVAVVRTTRRWPDVTCGNCLRQAPAQ